MLFSCLQGHWKSEILEKNWILIAISSYFCFMHTDTHILFSCFIRILDLLYGFVILSLKERKVKKEVIQIEADGPSLYLIFTHFNSCHTLTLNFLSLLKYENMFTYAISFLYDFYSKFM